jgi:hypothetical protein
VKYSLILAALTFGVSFWFVDFSKSTDIFRQAGPNEELVGVLRALALEDSVSGSGRELVVTLQEVEQSWRLSPATTAWLTNTPFSSGSIQIPSTPKHPRPYRATILLPNGGQFSFIYGSITNNETNGVKP